MGFLDRLTGRRAAGSPSEQSAEAGPSQPEFLAEAVPAASAAQADQLREAIPDFAGSSSALSSSDGGQRLYNPYEGINAAIDSRSGRPIAYKLPKQPEFLFSEEAAVHRRSWSENLTFYTGGGYLSGAVLGGAKGVTDAFRSQPEVAVNSMRLRVTRLLNMSGKSGRATGNALGVLGLFFSSAESALGYASDHSLPEAVNSVAAGAMTGALFRSPRGLRAAGVAGAVGAVAASLLVGARSTLSKSL